MRQTSSSLSRDLLEEQRRNDYKYLAQMRRKQARICCLLDAVGKVLQVISVLLTAIAASTEGDTSKGIVTGGVVTSVGAAACINLSHEFRKKSKLLRSQMQKFTVNGTLPLVADSPERDR